jgi:hypothetical protein
MDDKTQLIHDLENNLQLELPDQLDASRIEEYLSTIIDKLITDDFNSLVQMLYRIDVSESRIKQSLQENKDQNAGAIIAQLILERLRQKRESRLKFNTDSAPSDDHLDKMNPEEERW